MRTDKCLHRYDVGALPADLSAYWRERKWHTWGGRKLTTKDRSSRCEYALAAAWADTENARCVSSGEGGIASNTGNGYFGKWQADTAFAKAYHPTASRRWGPYAYAHDGKWPERDQDLMAWRGWKARGWYPWPTTARICGLI